MVISTVLVFFYLAFVKNLNYTIHVPITSMIRNAIVTNGGYTSISYITRRYTSISPYHISRLVSAVKYRSYSRKTYRLTNFSHGCHLVIFHRTKILPLTKKYRLLCICADTSYVQHSGTLSYLTWLQPTKATEQPSFDGEQPSDYNSYPRPYPRSHTNKCVHIYFLNCTYIAWYYGKCNLNNLHV